MSTPPKKFNVYVYVYEYEYEDGYELVAAKETGISVPETLDGVVCDPDVSDNE